MQTNNQLTVLESVSKKRTSVFLNFESSFILTRSPFMEQFKNLFGGYMKKRFPFLAKNNAWIELFNDVYIQMIESKTIVIYEGQILEKGEKIKMKRLCNLFTRKGKQILFNRAISKSNLFNRSFAQYEMIGNDGETFENPAMAKFIMSQKENVDCSEFTSIINNLLTNCSANKEKRYKRLLALLSVMDLEIESKTNERLKLGSENVVWQPKKKKMNDEQIILILNRKGSEFVGLFSNKQDLRTFKSTLANMPDELKNALKPLYNKLS